MPKITDEDFYLPEIYPTAYHQDLDNSANKPILITGVDQRKGIKDDFVVKLRGAERMSNEAFMRELLASFIALEMEISVVLPAVINIVPEFLELLKGHDSWAVASKSIGYNYGSHYKSGYNILLLNQPLNAAQLPFAQNIFAFDLLIQNTDRTNNKPNMLLRNDEIVILDHEIAFGFVFEILFSGTPGEFRENDFNWINNHCLLALIKGKPFDFEIFSSRLDQLNDNFWDTAWSLIPDIWKDKTQFDKIRHFISGVRSNKEKFIEELKKIMS